MNFDVGGPAQLVGRHDDLTLISTFVDDAAVNGRALLLVGEPGVGKTVVLDESVAMAAARGIRVLRAGGVEFEASVAYSGLNQLLFPLRESFGELSAVHREALEVALGFGQGPGKVAVSGCRSAVTGRRGHECGHGRGVIIRVSKSLITSGSPCPRCQSCRSLLPLTTRRWNLMR